jgi:hypothetical protein
MKQLLIILSVLFFASCSDDYIIENQIESIEAYIAAQYGEDYDAYISEGVYRYVGDNAFEDERERILIQDGSQVRINFDEYMFTNSPAEAPFFTNKHETASMEGYPFDTSKWILEPFEFKIGDEAMLSAVEEALIGCHRGDNIQVFITSDNGYGKQFFGNVPANTALMFDIEIL